MEVGYFFKYFLKVAYPTAGSNISLIVTVAKSWTASEASGGVNGADGGVNDFRKAILELMRVVPTISAQRIAAALGTTKRRVESNINAMKKAGLLERVGSDKTGHWEVGTGGNGIKPP